MAPGLHGSARTTPRVRAELQRAQATTRALAARHGLNPKTVAKWRKRTTAADAPMGPRRARGTVLTEAEGGDRRRVPAAHAAAARRRPGLPAREYPEADPEVAPPLPRAARHLPAAQGRGERLQAGPLRRDGDRPRAHRRLRAAPGPGQALPVPGQRPGVP